MNYFSLFRLPLQLGLIQERLLRHKFRDVPGDDPIGDLPTCDPALACLESLQVELVAVDGESELLEVIIVEGDSWVNT